MGSRYNRVRNFWLVIRAIDGGGIYSASVINLLFDDKDTDSEPIMTGNSYLKEKYFEFKREIEEKFNLELRLQQL